MTCDPSTLLLANGTFPVPAGAEGRTLVNSLTFDVPRRREGRTSAHRERFCLVALLKHLVVAEPDYFPAIIVRNESPDFLICSRSRGVIAVEHTDAGETEYQRHLAQTEDAAEAVMIPSPNGDGWRGDGPERAFLEALRASLLRKAGERVWRNAPQSAERWIMAYDQTNTGIFVSNEIAAGFLRTVARENPEASRSLGRIYLVRSQDVVLDWRAQEGAP